MFVLKARSSYDFSFKGGEKDAKQSGCFRGNEVEIFQEGHKDLLAVLPRWAAKDQSPSLDFSDRKGLAATLTS